MVVFSISGCCMCHVVKQLLFGLGVGPTVVELAGGRHSVPAVLVGGKFLGDIETLMVCHIDGTLVTLLKVTGALWL
ncbi:hypothetical protein PVL29_015484 [Vitis rotundifolia]|uniref:Glutaredoxin n=1 Tax=Vitis rotundifolia TaxID=103349 RepID=A0AA39DLQ4_VITRO|nr:hypothetical protein PVL29_015484 [Vitis rotundifolia]